MRGRDAFARVRPSSPAGRRDWGIEAATKLEPRTRRRKERLFHAGRLLPDTSMKFRRITLASVDRMQSSVDAAARLHRIGLLLFVAACVCITLPRTGLPAWMPLWLPAAGMVATVLAFVLKAAGTLREIRLADALARVMGMPYRRGFAARGLDHNAWSAIRSYVLVSVALTVAAALTPSMLAQVGETAYANLTVALSMAALAIQSFDNPRRLRHRVMQICSGRMELHAGDDDVLVA